MGMHILTFQKSSKDAVVALLEKAKADLPAKPKKVQSVPVVQSHISAKGRCQSAARQVLYGWDWFEMAPHCRCSNHVWDGKRVFDGCKRSVFLRVCGSLYSV